MFLHGLRRTAGLRLVGGLVAWSDLDVVRVPEALDPLVTGLRGTVQECAHQTPRYYK